MRETELPAVLEAAYAVAEVLEKSGVPYAIVGGIAGAVYGVPRTTRDVDLIVDVPKIRLPELLDSLREHGFELYVEEVRRELVEGGVSQLHYQGVAIDLMLVLLPQFRRAVESAYAFDTGGRMIRIVSAADLVTLKLLAGRPRDVDDVRSILATMEGELDKDAILKDVAAALGEQDERTKTASLLLRSAEL